MVKDIIKALPKIVWVIERLSHGSVSAYYDDETSSFDDNYWHIHTSEVSVSLSYSWIAKATLGEIEKVLEL